MRHRYYCAESGQIDQKNIKVSSLERQMQTGMSELEGHRDSKRTGVFLLVVHLRFITVHSYIYNCFLSMKIVMPSYFRIMNIRCFITCSDGLASSGFCFLMYNELYLIFNSRRQALVELDELTSL